MTSQDMKSSKQTGSRNLYDEYDKYFLYVAVVTSLLSSLLELTVGKAPDDAPMNDRFCYFTEVFLVKFM